MLSGDSRLLVLNDLSEPKTISELLRTGANYPIPTFSCVDGRITLGWVNRMVTLGEKRTWMVNLDDGTSIRASETQEFLLLDGTVKSLSGLQPGMSLMPLYLTFDKHGYPNYWEPSNYNLGALTSIDCQKVRKVARMVAEAKQGDRLSPNTRVLHIDSCRKNCHPNNLDVSVKENAKPRKFVHPYAKALKDAQEFIRLNKKNHKVVSVSIGEPETVYGLVASTDYLAVSGVFIKTVDCE